MQTTVVVFIPLTRGKVAVIDFDDFEKVRGLNWYAVKSVRGFYAARKSPAIHMHRIITACPPGMETNHKNGDGLDNRRENLKIVTHQQNSFAHQSKHKNASSIYRGVCRYKRSNNWSAQIHKNGKKIFLGYFDSEKKAAVAYDAKARELFGEHAAPNF